MEITVFDLKQKLASGEEFLLIDVREPYEYQDFNLGARLIPLAQIPESLSTLEDWKDKEIVVYCRVGSRSRVAQEWMLRAGFARVHNLEGGVLAWIEAFGR